MGKLLASADIKAFWSQIGRAASYWPCTFLHPRCFCLAYHYFLQVWLHDIHQEMSELLDKQVNAQEEKTFWSSH